MGIKLEMFNNEPGLPFAAGERIFREGDAAESMFVVLEGDVDISILGEHIETLGPGEPFGEMALVDKASRIATAVAKTPVKLAVISEKRFLFLVEQTPYFALQVMKVMSDRLRRMNDLRVSGAAATA